MGAKLEYQAHETGWWRAVPNVREFYHARYKDTVGFWDTCGLKFRLVPAVPGVEDGGET